MSTTPKSRIASLDVLRGIAIIGIIPVNVQHISNWGYNIDCAGSPPVTGVDYFVNFALAGRMMPLFALLFGIGFELFLHSATTRTSKPRMVMLRRLIFLLAVGLVHFIIYPGEVLASYALGALIFLLPASFLPRWVGASLGLLFLIGTAPFSGIVTIPGLFLTGSMLVRYDLLGLLHQRKAITATAFAVLAGAAAVASYLQYPEVHLGDFSSVGRVAGTLTMLSIFLGVILVMHLPMIARALEMIFAPLGRMAFSNYLGATVLVILLGVAIGAEDLKWRTEYGLFVAAGIAALQWVFSTLWLRFFTYGPLEWVWRTVTWWIPQPLRQRSR